MTCPSCLTYMEKIADSDEPLSIREPIPGIPPTPLFTKIQLPEVRPDVTA
jgi:hypothetical protein